MMFKLRAGHIVKFYPGRWGMVTWVGYKYFAVRCFEDNKIYRGYPIDTVERIFQYGHIPYPN